MRLARTKRQAGGIVFRWNGDGPEVLIVTAYGNRKRWVLPKGSVRRFERASYAALREVREEAGVEGRVVAPAGTVDVSTSGGEVKLQYFLVQHLRDTTTKEKRLVKWCAVEDAIQQLSFASARKALLDANPEIWRFAKKRARR